MPTPKYMLLVAKSRAACLSAIKSYNRASSLYREETFAILMINAWELLLKADLPPSSGPYGLLVDNVHRRHIWVEVERSGTGGRIWRCRRFRGRWPVAQAAARAHGVVMPPPCLDHHLGQPAAVEGD